MTVKGADKVVERLRKAAESARDRVAEALMEGANLVLADMKMLTPVDPKSSNHARDALTIVQGKTPLVLHIGLPTKDLAEDYFWFRFLDGGTQGYTPEPTMVRRVIRTDKAGERKVVIQEEMVARRTTPGSHTTKLISRPVPPRPALRIRERAMDGNRDDIERLVRQAVAEALKG